MDSLTPGAVLAAYYRPLVAALLEAPQGQVRDNQAMTIAQLPGIDLALGIPAAIVTIIRTLPLSGPIETGQLLDVGAALLRVVRSRQLTSQGETDELDEEVSIGLQDRLRPYTGMDGVYIRPGPSWLRPLR